MSLGERTGLYKAPASIAAPSFAVPPAKLTFDKPAVSTYAPATGWTAPAGTNSSYSNMPAAGSQQQWNAPAKTWQAPVMSQPAPPVAPAPPPPPVGGAKWYGGLDKGAKAAQSESWLGGDSDYTAQLGEYDRALNDFISRIKTQKDNFQIDADKATAATDQNQAMAGDQLAEDFGARGMIYSGLLDKSKGNLDKRFTDQKANITTTNARNKSDADNRLADYQSENNIGRSNAKRSALTRMAAQQAMIDSNVGL